MLLPALIAVIVSGIALRLLGRAGGLPFDRPNARSLHRDIVPRGGGVAIWIGWCAATVWLPDTKPWLLPLAAVVVAVSILASVDGARGAAIGTSGVELANAVIGAWLLAHGHAHLRPSMRVLPKVAVAIAIAAAPALLDVSEPARVAISAALYVVVLLLLRALPSELLALLPGRLRRAG